MSSEIIRNLLMSHNWNNKLQCDFFTTIRSASIYNVDTLKIGKTVNIKGIIKSSFHCRILYSKKVQFKNIPKALIMLDCGYPYLEACNIFAKMNNCTAIELQNIYFIYVLLQVIK